MKNFTLFLFMLLTSTSFFGQSVSCDHYIDSTNAGAWNGNIVGFGETVCIRAYSTGFRNEIRIKNLTGSLGNEIIVRPATNSAITFGISDTTIAYCVVFEHCEHFIFTGANIDNEKYGIKIDISNGKDSACSAISTKNACTDFTIENIEIYSDTALWIHPVDEDNVGQSGILSNPTVSSDLTITDNWGETFSNGDTIIMFEQKNVIFRDIYIHDINSTGIYLGNTQWDYKTYNLPQANYDSCEHAQIKNAKVYNCIFENIGQNPLQLTSCSGEYHAVYNNTFKNTSLRGLSGQTGAIYLGGGTRNTEIYNNTIIGSIGHAISGRAYNNIKVFNNIIISPTQDPDTVYPPIHGTYFEILTPRPNEGCFDIIASDPLFEFYNNTIINPKTDGISFKPFSRFNVIARNNIIINESPSYIWSFVYFKFPPDTSTGFDWVESNNYKSNNSVGNSYGANTTLMSEIFVDPDNDDFKLIPGSPAFNAGDTISIGIDYDIAETHRIKCGRIDIGAFENLTSIWVNGKDDWDSSPYDTSSYATVYLDTLLPLHVGDFIGAFSINGDGYYNCGGYLKWQGVFDSLKVFKSNSLIDGLSEYDDYIWIVWDSVRGEEHIYNANYDESYPQTNIFETGGQSKLKSLYDEQNIILKDGWNIFSTYIIPTNDSIHKVIQDIDSNISIIEHYTDEYVPGSSSNTLLRFEIGKAYKVKMSSPDTLVVKGIEARPEETPIPLLDDWNLLAYLLKTSELIEPILLSIEDNMIVVKDEDGIVYWPMFDINNIINMSPGKGYELKMWVSDTLTYPSNYYATNSKSTNITNAPQHYICNIKSNNNLCLGIFDMAWQTKPMIGDEIGVFDSYGNLVGSGVYRSGNLAITVWGDDETDVNKNGLEEFETFTIKLFHISNSVEEEMKIDIWLQGDNLYEENKVCVIGKFVQNSKKSLGTFYISDIYPNPSKSIANIDVFLPMKSDINITISNIYGHIIKSLDFDNREQGNHNLTIDLAEFSSGTYVYTISSTDYKQTKLLSIVK